MEIDYSSIRKAALDSINLEYLDSNLLENSEIKKLEIDALVILKIVSHVQSNRAPVTGQLLGVDQLEVLQVTHSFPFLPQDSDFNEDKAQEYQRNMLINLRNIDCDANTVGWYQSTYLGSFWNEKLIETQFNYQTTFPQSVVLIYDPTRTVQGGISFLALRLTDNFLKFYENKKFTTESLATFKLTPSLIFDSIPITIRRSYLLETLLDDLHEMNTLVPSLEESFNLPNTNYKFSESWDLPLIKIDSYELGFDKYLQRHIEYLGDCVEEYGQEQWRWQGWHRTLVKESTKLTQQANQRKQDNTSRTAKGLEPIYSGDDLAISSQNLTKILSNEPSRLETLLIMNQMETYCNQLDRFVGPTLTESLSRNEAVIE